MFQSALLKLPEGGVPLFSGLHLGVRHNVAPLWVAGTNVRFNNNSVQKAMGFLKAFTSGATTPVRGAVAQLTSSGQNLFYGTKSTLYKWNTVTESVVGSSYNGVDTATVTQDVTRWDFDTWGSWIVASNGVDPVQVYKGTSFTALANTPFTYAKAIVKLGPYLIAANTSNGSNMIEWCHDDDIENWTISASTTAGNYNIRDLESGIIAAIPFGTRVALFAKDSMHLVQYTGNNFVFGVSAGPKGIGAVSSASSVAVGNRLYGLSQAGFFITDGNTAQYIDEPSVREYYQATINEAQISKVNAYHNKLQSTVVWYLTDSTGNVTWSLSYDYTRKVWSKGDYGRDCSLARDVFSDPITFGTDFTPYWENSGSNADTVALSASIESKPFDGQDSSVVKWIDSLTVMAETTGTLQIALGFQEKLTDAVSWTTANFVGDSDTLYYERSARWVRLKIFSTDLGNDWEVSQIRLNGKRLGGGLQ